MGVKYTLKGLNATSTEVVSAHCIELMIQQKGVGMLLQVSHLEGSDHTDEEPSD